MKLSIPLPGDQSLMNCPALLPRADPDVPEARDGQHALELVDGNGPRDAGGIRCKVALHFLRYRGRGDRVRHCQAAAMLQDPERLAKDLLLLGRKIDDTVGNDHVHGGICHRQVLDLSEPEIHGRNPCLLGVLPGKGNHGRGHVDADHAAAVAHRPRGQEAVEPAAAAEVEDGLARASTRRWPAGCRTPGPGSSPAAPRKGPRRCSPSDFDVSSAEAAPPQQSGPHPHSVPCPRATAP